MKREERKSKKRYRRGREESVRKGTRGREERVSKGMKGGWKWKREKQGNK